MFQTALGPDHSRTINTDLGEIAWDRLADVDGRVRRARLRPRRARAGAAPLSGREALRGHPRRRRADGAPVRSGPAVLQGHASGAGDAASSMTALATLPMSSGPMRSGPSRHAAPAQCFSTARRDVSLGSRHRRRRLHRPPADRGAGARTRLTCDTIVAATCAWPPRRTGSPASTYEIADIRATDSPTLFRRHAVDCRRASRLPSLRPGRHIEPDAASTRSMCVGTQHVLDACLAAGVRKLIYTSSGAAYGYHADNPAMARRGRCAARQPGVRVLRPQAPRRGDAGALARASIPSCCSSSSGPARSSARAPDNQITDMFDKPLRARTRAARRARS